MKVKTSLVIPLLNESESLSELFVGLKELNLNDFEVIFVDDGSSDDTASKLSSLTSDDKYKVIHLRRNYGQTAALAAGFDHASGDIIVAMDGDLENDPKDIPALIKKMQEGYDVVSGWRKGRWKKHTLSRRIPSQIANAIISYVTGVKLHDYGCTLKAYRRDVLKDVKLYGEMHRFIPAFAVWQGANVTEIPVTYSPRRYGRSKYGFNRIFSVLLDLITVKFITDYSTKPMHFFGKFAFWSFIISGITGVWAVYLKFFGALTFTQTPLPLFTALFLLVGIQFLLMGLVAEMMTRNYFENSGKPIYNIREKINF